MSPFSDFFADSIADTFNGTDLIGSAQIDVGLHVGAPGTDGAANELVGGGYARTAVGAFTVAPVATGHQVANTAPVIFPVGTADIPGVTHFSLWNNATGDCWFVGDLDAPIQWTNGSQVSFSAGALSTVMRTTTCA